MISLPGQLQIPMNACMQNCGPVHNFVKETKLAKNGECVNRTQNKLLYSLFS